MPKKSGKLIKFPHIPRVWGISQEELRNLGEALHFLAEYRLYYGHCTTGFEAGVARDTAILEECQRDLQERLLSGAEVEPGPLVMYLDLRIMEHGKVVVPKLDGLG